MVRHEPSKNSRAYVILGGEPLTEITFAIPGLRWEHVTVGKHQVLSLTCLTPITESRTKITQIVWSDHPAFLFLKPFVAWGARIFLRHRRDVKSPFGLRFGQILGGARELVVEECRKVGAPRPEVMALLVIGLVIASVEGILDGRISGVSA